MTYSHKISGNRSTVLYHIVLCCFVSLCIAKAGDVAQWLEHQNSNLRALGSIPWWGRLRDHFSVPPSQLLRRLVCA